MRILTRAHGAISEWLDACKERDVAHFAGFSCSVSSRTSPDVDISAEFYLRAKAKSWRNWRNYVRQCGYVCSRVSSLLSKSLVVFSALAFWFAIMAAFLEPAVVHDFIASLVRAPPAEKIADLAWSVVTGYLLLCLMALLFMLFISTEHREMPRAFSEAVERDIRAEYPELRGVEGPFEVILYSFDRPLGIRD